MYIVLDSFVLVAVLHLHLFTNFTPRAYTSPPWAHTSHRGPTRWPRPLHSHWFTLWSGVFTPCSHWSLLWAHSGPTTGINRSATLLQADLCSVSCSGNYFIIYIVLDSFVLVAVLHMHLFANFILFPHGGPRSPRRGPMLPTVGPHIPLWAHALAPPTSLSLVHSLVRWFHPLFSLVPVVGPQQV